VSAIYLGSLSVGDVVPAALRMQAGLRANLSASVQAAASVNASLKASVADPASLLASAVHFVGSGQAAAGLALVSPAQLLGSLNTSLSANVALSASLQVQLAPVDALGLLLSTAGVHLYRVDNRVDHVGSDLSAALPPPGVRGTDSAQALVLMTTEPAVWTALAGVLKAT